MFAAAGGCRRLGRFRLVVASHALVAVLGGGRLGGGRYCDGRRYCGRRDGPGDERERGGRERGDRERDLDLRLS